MKKEPIEDTSHDPVPDGEGEGLIAVGAISVVLTIIAILVAVFWK